MPIVDETGNYLIGINSYGPAEDSGDYLKYIGAANTSDVIELIAQKRKLTSDQSQKKNSDVLTLEGMKEGFYAWNEDCQLSGVWAASDNGVLFVNAKDSEYLGYEERVVPHSGHVNMAKLRGPVRAKKVTMERVSQDENKDDYGTSKLTVDQTYMTNFYNFVDALYGAMAKLDGAVNKYYRKIAPSHCH